MNQQVTLGVREWGADPQDNFDQWPPAQITIKPGQQLVVSLSDYRTIVMTVDFEGFIDAYIESPDGAQLTEPVTLAEEYTL